MATSILTNVSQNWLYGHLDFDERFTEFAMPTVILTNVSQNSLYFDEPFTVFHEVIMISSPLFARVRLLVSVCLEA